MSSTEILDPILAPLPGLCDPSKRTEAIQLHSGALILRTAGLRTLQLLVNRPVFGLSSNHLFVLQQTRFRRREA
jgi:hypothetical protein